LEVFGLLAAIMTSTMSANTAKKTTRRISGTGTSPDVAHALLRAASALVPTHGASGRASAEKSLGAAGMSAWHECLMPHSFWRGVAAGVNVSGIKTKTGRFVSGL
jgi:hypothetical protein